MNENISSNISGIYFVHIPKTGGQAVSKWARENNFKIAVNVHSVTGRKPKNFWGFTVIRNPYDRYVSLINYMQNKNLPLKLSMVKDIYESLNIPIDLNLIIKAPEKVQSNIAYFNPQTDFIKESDSLELIYKYEDGLANLTKTICDTLKLTEEKPLEIVNKSKEVFTIDMLTEEQKDVIKTKYASDFAFGNYQMTI